MADVSAHAVVGDGWLYLSRRVCANGVSGFCRRGVGGLSRQERKMLRFTEVGQTVLTGVLLLNLLPAKSTDMDPFCCRRGPRRSRRVAATGVRVFYSESHSGRHDVRRDGVELSSI